MTTKRSTTKRITTEPKRFELTVKMPGLEAALVGLVTVAREAATRDHARSDLELASEEHRTEQAKLAHEVSMARMQLERDELALRRAEFDERVAERAERKAEAATGRKLGESGPRTTTKDW
jgi:hypothetical protein